MIQERMMGEMTVDNIKSCPLAKTEIEHFLKIWFIVLESVGRGVEGSH